MAEQSDQVEPLVPWARLQNVMAAQGVDAVVATSHVNVTYLSDFWSMSQWSRRSAQVHAVVGFTPRRDVDVIVPAGNTDLVLVEGRLQPSRLWVYGSFVVRGLDHVPDELPEEAAFRRALVQDSSPSPVEALAHRRSRSRRPASPMARSPPSENGCRTRGSCQARLSSARSVRSSRSGR
jgi:Creatinase/Prolidase N-terminal domain